MNSIFILIIVFTTFLSTLEGSIDKMYSSVRGAGMANSIKSISEDADIIFINPANLGNLNKSGIGITYSKVNTDINSINIFYAQKFNGFGVGAGYYTYFLENIENINYLKETAGKFDINKKEIYISSGAKLGKSIFVGGKFNSQEDIFYYSRYKETKFDGSLLIKFSDNVRSSVIYDNILKSDKSILNFSFGVSFNSSINIKKNNEVEEKKVMVEPSIEGKKEKGDLKSVATGNYSSGRGDFYSTFFSSQSNNMEGENDNLEKDDITDSLNYIDKSGVDEKNKKIITENISEKKRSSRLENLFQFEIDLNYKIDIKKIYDITTGLEWWIGNIFSIRGGIIVGLYYKNFSFTIGSSLKIGNNIRLDYAYVNSNSIFNNHSFGLLFSF